MEGSDGSLSDDAAELPAVADAEAEAGPSPASSSGVSNGSFVEEVIHKPHKQGGRPLHVTRVEGTLWATHEPVWWQVA